MDSLLDGLKSIGLFFTENLAGVIFLIGLAFIVFAIFLFNTILGYLAVGVALVLIALILVKESQVRR